MSRNQTLMKGLSLVVGCVVQLFSGSINMVPLYMNALKCQYNFTQTTDYFKFATTFTFLKPMRAATNGDQVYTVLGFMSIPEAQCACDFSQIIPVITPNSGFEISQCFTQSESLEILPSMIVVGRGLTPLASLVFQNFGPAPTFVVGLILGSGGYILLWSTAFSKEFYQSYPGVMGVYFFLIGHGSVYISLGLLTVVTRNFSGQHRGKAVSLLESCYGATQLCLLVIYRLWFSEGIHRDDENQQLVSFFLFNAILTAVLAMACTFLVRPIYTDGAESILSKDHKSHDYEYQTLDGDTHPHDTQRLVSETTGGPPLKDDRLLIKQNNETLDSDAKYWKTICFVLRPFISWPAHLLLWSYSLSKVVSVGVELNFSVYTKSVGLYSWLDSAIIAYTVTLFVSRLSIGPISFYLQNSVPLMTYISIMSFVSMATFGAATLMPGTVATVMVISVVTGTYVGVTKIIAILVVAKVMDERYFAIYWGIDQFLASGLMLVWQRSVAGLYESMIPDGTSLECFGDNCIRWTFLVACVLSLIATVFSILVAVIKRY